MGSNIAAVIGPVAHSDEWYSIRLFDPERNERPIVFGASEAAEACNLSPYSAGPLELFMKKRSLKPSFEGNEATEWGTLIEPVVLTMYERKFGVDLQRDLPMYFHGEYSFMGATPDALVKNAADHFGFSPDGPSEAVDAKSSTFRMVDATGEDENKYGEEETDQVPTYIVCQAQQQCAVLNLERVHFPVLIDRRIRRYTVERNDDFIAMIVSAEKELAERIINNDPPEPNWTHPETKRLLNDMYGYEQGKAIDLGDDDLLHWTEYEKLGQEIKELEKKRSGHRNQLLAKLQDAELGRLPAGKKELRRCVVSDSFWTEADVTEISMKIGQVKRRGSERLLIRKVK